MPPVHRTAHRGRSAEQKPARSRWLFQRRQACGSTLF